MKEKEREREREREKGQTTLENKFLFLHFSLVCLLGQTTTNNNNINN